MGRRGIALSLCPSPLVRLLHKVVFMLRQVQHERKIINLLHTRPVRPELVEG